MKIVAFVLARFRFFFPLPEAQSAEGVFILGMGAGFWAINSISHIFSFSPHYWVVGGKLQGAALLQLS